MFERLTFRGSVFVVLSDIGLYLQCLTSLGTGYSLWRPTAEDAGYDHQQN